MPVAVVDSNVLIDYRDERSDRHERAQAIVGGIDHGDLPAGRVTNYVVLETLNWLHERKRHDLAVDTYHRLDASAGFEVVHCAQTDFTRAAELFETYDELAFGDATIAAFMERTDVEYIYSFDADFDTLNRVTRLDTPDDPFA